MTDDAKLLQDYAEHGSEAAFGELVARYVDLVYSTALRQVNGDAHLAQDVTQSVFIDLARRASVLTNGTELTANLDHLISETRPVMTNLAIISDQIRDPQGSLGEWLIPTNLQQQLQQTLASANTTLTNTDANLTSLAEKLDQSLINLANLTSNLNAQVQINTNILSELSTAITDTDELVQGLKRHWLLRSAFRSSTNRPPPRPAEPKAGKLP